jgi:hypothetical protein
MLMLYNRTYFPEEFLWRTFHSLALVAQIMDDGRYFDMDTMKIPTVPYTVIHSDIKPLNGKCLFNSHSLAERCRYPILCCQQFGVKRGQTVACHDL